MSSEDKRQELKARIEAAEKRNEDRTAGQLAKDAVDTATEFVKQHPLATIAGVAALGLVIGAMTRPGRRVGRQTAGRASALVGYAADIGLAYASGLMDAAGDASVAGKDKLEDLGDALNDNAGAIKRKAVHSGGNAAAAVRKLSREAGKKAGRSARDLRSRVAR